MNSSTENSLSQSSERTRTAFGPSNFAIMGKSHFVRRCMQGGLGVFEQGINGGANFLTLLIVQHACGATQLGLFSLGFSVLILVGIMQEALICTPFTVFSNRMREQRRQTYLGSSLVLLVGLTLLMVAFVGLTGVTMLAFQGDPSVAFVVLSLILALPFWLFRDFARRIAFAELNLFSAAKVSITAGLLQVTFVGAIAYVGLLNARTAFWAAAVGCFCGGAVWCFLYRKKIRLRLKSSLWALKKNWILGRWVVGGQVASMAAMYLIPWLLVAQSDLRSVGVFTACESILRLANPVILAISNLLTPHAAIAFSSGGTTQVKSVVKRTTILLSIVMTIFCLAVFWGGRQLLGIFFGEEFQAYHLTLIALTAGHTIAMLAMPAEKGLLVFEKQQLNMFTQIVCVVVSLVSSFFLIAHMGVLGGALGYLVGRSSASLLIAFFFIQTVSRGETDVGKTSEFETQCERRGKKTSYDVDSTH